MCVRPFIHILSVTLADVKLARLHFEEAYIKCIILGFPKARQKAVL